VRALAIAGIVFAIAIPAIVLWRFSVHEDTPPAAVARGTLSVTSEPNADILLDGYPLARTPWTGMVSLGKHDVEVTAPGFAPSHSAIDVTADKLANVHVALTKQL
jgi:hypothetical protein